MNSKIKRVAIIVLLLVALAAFDSYNREFYSNQTNAITGAVVVDDGGNICSQPTDISYPLSCSN